MLASPACSQAQAASQRRCARAGVCTRNVHVLRYVMRSGRAFCARACFRAGNAMRRQSGSFVFPP